MNYWVNLSIIFIIIGFVLFIVAMLILHQRQDSKRYKRDDDRAKFKFDVLMEFIKKRMNEITNENLYSKNFTAEEFKRRKKRIQELKEALNNCNTGDIASKIYVRESLSVLLRDEYHVDENNIDWIIPFDKPNEMSAREKFETLLQLKIKEHGSKALEYLINEFNLDRERKNKPYAITEDDVNQMYKTIVGKKKLQFEDKLRVVSQILYSHYKGFGIVDEIRDMAIDGVMGGVSGSSGKIKGYKSDQDFLKRAVAKKPSNMNSAWILYKGNKKIHLSFLSFEHESELIRVTTNFYKYRRPGQLSESQPAIISDMFDESRITVFRPPLTESWAFFNRKKYDAESVELEEMYPQPNAELPIKTLKFLMKGNCSMAVTGAMGSGKTSLIMALVKYIRSTLTLRIQESDFELNLRSLYPYLNILSFQETDVVSGQAGLDYTKKTDGDVTILGEVATDPVAAWMIQISQVASKFNLFTHHAKKFSLLIDNLINSLLKTGVSKDRESAERQVVQAIDFNTHLHDDRFIERITECIPLELESEDSQSSIEMINNAKTMDEKLSIFVEMGAKYFYQKTSRRQYVARNIIEFRDGQYIAVHPISEERVKEIESNLTEEERLEFKEFIKAYWGQSA